MSGKKRRITLFECPNDVGSMIDLAKVRVPNPMGHSTPPAPVTFSAWQVADLVLLVVDASFGFEMETFEFLNVLQVHGMPKIMGVLTHLDTFTSAKTLKTIKKRRHPPRWTHPPRSSPCARLG